MAWKKGQSGNPNGKPKVAAEGGVVARKVLEELRKVEIGDGKKKRTVEMMLIEVLLRQLAREALNGDKVAYKELVNRAYGMPRQSMEVSTPPGAGIQFIIMGDKGGKNGDGKVKDEGIRVIEGE